jgi:hypothetical protein
LLSKNVKILIYRTIIWLPFYVGLLLRNKHRLRVCDNRELRKICGPGREVIGDWRMLHKEELTYLYSSSNII